MGLPHGVGNVWSGLRFDMPLGFLRWIICTMGSTHHAVLTYEILTG